VQVQLCLGHAGDEVTDFVVHGRFLEPRLLESALFLAKSVRLDEFRRGICWRAVGSLRADAAQRDRADLIPAIARRQRASNFSPLGHV
jgi:hypothetical protein